jgi:diguanylate cyclase (GGDEF)-like protein
LSIEERPAQGPTPVSDGPASAVGGEAAVMAGWLFAAGATIGQLSLLLPIPPHANVGALEVNIGVAYVGSAAMFLIFRRLPLWAMHIAMLAGTLIITRAVYYSGEGVSYYGIWYLWVALFTFSYFRRVEAALHVALAGACYAVVLAVRHEPVAQARLLTTITSLLIAGVFIDSLVRRVRRQRQQAADSASNLTAVVQAMQRIFQETSAEGMRADLCGTAASVAGADVAVLWEPQPGGRALAPTAIAGERVMADEVSLGDSPAGASRAYEEGCPGFACIEERHGLELQAEERASISCALWQPVLQKERTIAVLALYWKERVGSPDENVRATIALLAAQAAAAIERIALLARLESIAHTDELTGLLNRRAWREAVPREMARAEREGWPLCVAMLDVDGLKELNDRDGHHAGDQLLKQNAAAWSSALRPVDILARYGGDEFAVMLTGCRLEDAERLIERFVEATPADRSFSVGIAEWDGSKSIHALMAEADARLYAAKAKRGKFVVAAG